MPISVRTARSEDAPVLVRLRLAIAERHVHLAPHIYRLPDETAGREHFEQVLADGSGELISVAEPAGEVVGMVGEVVGMVEVVPLTDPNRGTLLSKQLTAD